MIPLTKDQMIKRNQKSKMHHQKKFFKLALRKYSQNEHLESTPPAVSGERNQQLFDVRFANRFLTFLDLKTALKKLKYSEMN